MKYIFKFLFYSLKSIYVCFYYSLIHTILFLFGIFLCIWHFSYSNTHFVIARRSTVKGAVFHPQVLAFHFVMILILIVGKTAPNP